MIVNWLLVSPILDSYFLQIMINKVVIVSNRRMAHDGNSGIAVIPIISSFANNLLRTKNSA
jgi:hypothetical protein